MTETCARQLPAWQAHRHTESTDSETSFFDPSSSASTPGDSWSGYFEGWNESTQDGYCPEIASASNSPTRTDQSDETPKYDADGLLPSACLGKTRPTSIRRNAEIQQSPLQPRRRTKRYGIVPYADPDPGNVAVTNLNNLLHNSMSNTEDILAAMYSSDWDAASLQKWYDQSQKSPADLALFKIMFSLRYTTEETSPSATR